MKKEKPKYRQIIDAAIVVIAENGYHQSQVSKIAKQAGVADGTIYLYFKNKEDILISVFDEKMEMFADRLHEIIEEPISASEKLYKMVENHFTVLSADRHLATVTQLELRQSNLALRLRINAVLKNYLVLLDTILKEGIANGEFDKNMDIRLARQMVFGTIDETTTTWVMNEYKYNLVALSSKVHQLLVNAIKAE
ncbi:TetR/AcrR family transcriptional regulator [Chryseomicrobium aureum]|uniref:TetR/AcrR family transcriptional regulator n=1 Tax=Chryseomicrobium aureum TaxID=1441723 RepID=UPI00195AC554|nr:TetR/AcrR family transcriptional regulator [Chryseomicrobium aureum]MBM7706733.1 TetR/AcrR family fatty acid metabolism transcriptional regulator [Chryseomicrobium aureum]